MGKDAARGLDGAGPCRPGPITIQFQAAGEAILRGATDAHAAWRTPVHGPACAVREPGAAGEF